MRAGQRLHIGDRMRAAELGRQDGARSGPPNAPRWVLISDPLWSAYQTTFNAARRQEVPTDGPAR